MVASKGLYRQSLDISQSYLTNLEYESTKNYIRIGDTLMSGKWPVGK